jgi:hypothetical protein
MTITQTVNIPASRRLVIDVPSEVPAGATARFELNVFPFEKKDENSELPLKSLEGAETPRADRLLGAAANMGGISLDEIREERLAKHLV